MIRYNSKIKKWVLYTHDGKRVLGQHATKAQALAQERAVMATKIARRRGK